MSKHKTKKHFRLFLASPGDVQAERDAVEEVVKHFNLNNDHGIHIDVIRWEDFATPNSGRPQQVIFENTDFKNTDIFVGIFWYRIGSPTGKIDPQTKEEYLSGTIEELKACLDLIYNGRLTLDRFMLYFCEKPIPKTDLESLKQATKVAKFREELDKTKKLLYQKFNTIDNFKLIFMGDLERAVEDIIPKLSQIASISRSFSKVSKFGPIITKMCNRNRQVTDFLRFFPEKFSECPKRPQFYFIHGNDGEGHESFIKRLVKTNIKNFAEKVWGDQYGPIYFQPIPYPHVGNLNERKAELETNLFLRFAEWYTGKDYSINKLVRLPHLSKHHLIVIEHNIYASKWDKLCSQLINWYIRDYWALLDRDEEIPQFLIFFNIKYSKMKQTINLLRWKKYSAKEIKAQLKKLHEISDKKCPCTIITELTSITVEDVQEWFRENGIYENETIRNEKINRMFKEKERVVNYKRMSEIEILLEEIYNEYLEEREL